MGLPRSPSWSSGLPAPAHSHLNITLKHKSTHSCDGANYRRLASAFPIAQVPIVANWKRQSTVNDPRQSVGRRTVDRPRATVGAVVYFGHDLRIGGELQRRPDTAQLRPAASPSTTQSTSSVAAQLQNQAMPRSEARSSSDIAFPAARGRMSNDRDAENWAVRLTVPELAGQRLPPFR